MDEEANHGGSFILIKAVHPAHTPKKFPTVSAHNAHEWHQNHIFNTTPIAFTFYWTKWL